VKKSNLSATAVSAEKEARLNPVINQISGCDDLLPCLESTSPFGLVVRGRKQMSFRSEVSCHDTLNFEKTLRMLRRLEALHLALSLPGRLMRVLRSIVEVPALSMSDARKNHFLRSAVATELVRNDHARLTPTAPQQLSEESHSSKPIPLGLHQNIDYGSLLIDGAPEIMLHSIDLQNTSSRNHLSPSLGRLRFSLAAYAAPNVSHQRRIVS
jgi:hypothetical protein